ncbi:MAG: hypothetical protein JRJ84_25920 [Deltaproteobacteria bacterium]|nr:hypothetical protein [Deltaproteobacteria bacterium]
MRDSTPDALWLFDGGQYLTLPDMGLKTLSMVDEDAPVPRWPVDQLLPSGMLEDDPLLARFWVRPGTDIDGTDSLLLVVLLVDNTNPASMDLTWWAASWTEAAGIRWNAILEDFDGWDVRYSGLDGGVALYLTEAPVRWRVLRGDVPAEGALDAVACPDPRPGPLLDPTGPTFVLLCRTADKTADQLAILHGGQEVWLIDALTFGLQERTVPIADLIVLPPLE